MKQAYVEKRFHSRTMRLIETANTVIEEYLRDGHTLTVRQLYYQLVARDFIPNSMQSYKVLVSVVTDAREAGLMDWDAIEDRTREVWSRPSWGTGKSILQSAAHSFHMNMWDDQPNVAIVVIEKEALAGVMQRVCHELDLPFLAARGYPSATVVRDLCNDRISRAVNDGRHVTIFHLGDHDPSGLDMTRDLIDRFGLFVGIDLDDGDWSLKRIALNMDQIKRLKPPKNPAKSTDSRYAEYKKQFGESSWELDALDPKKLTELVKSNVEPLIDRSTWEDRVAVIEATRRRLQRVADSFKG